MIATWPEHSRLRQLADQGTDAFRVWSCREGWIDWLAGRVLISAVYPEAPEEWICKLRSWVSEVSETPIQSIHYRRLVQGPGENNKPLKLWGEESGEFTVRENGMAFQIDLTGGYSTGLFLDQRIHRDEIRKDGFQKVLNCFSYTCSFSLAAALGGAQTTSVDIARRCLERGKQNFERNGISVSGHRFVCEDVRKYFARISRRGEKFDLVVLDPPTFSRTKVGGVFRVERDLSELLNAALEVCEPDFRILLSTNCRRIGIRDLHQLAENEIFRKKLEASVRPGTIPREFSGAGCASTVWVDCGNFRK